MESSWFIELIHPGQILFGLAVLLFGSAFTLSFLIGTKARIVSALTTVLFAILFLLLGTVAIEFSAAATPSYTFGEFASLSQALSTHRWLLFELPIILTMTGLLILWVYGGRIAEPHARPYRAALLICIAVSFASLAAIVFESML